MPGPVERWLETFMCKQYAKTFEGFGYKTLESVCQLQLHQLLNMGVAREHCEKVLENVHVLRQTLLAGSNISSRSELSSLNPRFNSASSALRSVAMNANYYRGKMSHYQDDYTGYGPNPGQMPGVLYQNHYEEQATGHVEPGLGGYPMGAGYREHDPNHLMMNAHPQQSMAGSGRMYPQQMQQEHYMSQQQQQQQQPPPEYGSQGAMRGQQYPAQYGGMTHMAGAGGYYGPMGQSQTSQAMANSQTAHRQLQGARQPPGQVQNPQQVADDILQMASSTYPLHHTVQVPLGKNRHAPYHIPRSPHYNMSASSSPGQPPPAQMTQQQQQPPQAPVGQQQQPGLGGMTGNRGMMYPVSSPHSQQSRTSPTSPMHMHSPVSYQSLPSPGSMHSPASGGVKSPVPSNVSPGAGGMRSPCSMQASPMSMGSQQMMSPVHMNPGSGSCQQIHSPPSRPCSSMRSPPSQSHSQLYSPSPMHSPSYQPQSKGPLHSPPSSSQGLNNPSTSSSPYISDSSLDSSAPHQGGLGPSNPLQSLQKLVMLPEKQVVDPKSVVNDACVPSPQSTEGSKNCEGSAEQQQEDYSCSAGCSELSSPPLKSNHMATTNVRPGDAPCSEPAFSAMDRDVKMAVEKEQKCREMTSEKELQDATAASESNSLCDRSGDHSGGHQKNVTGSDRGTQLQSNMVANLGASKKSDCDTEVRADESQRQALCDSVDEAPTGKDVRNFNQLTGTCDSLQTQTKSDVQLETSHLQKKQPVKADSNVSISQDLKRSQRVHAPSPLQNTKANHHSPPKKQNLVQKKLEPSKLSVTSLEVENTDEQESVMAKVSPKSEKSSLPSKSSEQQSDVDTCKSESLQVQQNSQDLPSHKSPGSLDENAEATASESHTVKVDVQVSKKGDQPELESASCESASDGDSQQLSRTLEDSPSAGTVKGPIQSSSTSNTLHPLHPDDLSTSETKCKRDAEVKEAEGSDQTEVTETSSKGAITAVEESSTIQVTKDLTADQKCKRQTAGSKSPNAQSIVSKQETPESKFQPTEGPSSRQIVTKKKTEMKASLVEIGTGRETRSRRFSGPSTGKAAGSPEVFGPNVNPVMNGGHENVSKTSLSDGAVRSARKTPGVRVTESHNDGVKENVSAMTGTVSTAPVGKISRKRAVPKGSKENPLVGISKKSRTIAAEVSGLSDSEDDMSEFQLERTSHTFPGQKHSAFSTSHPSSDPDSDSCIVISSDECSQNDFSPEKINRSLVKSACKKVPVSNSSSKLDAIVRNLASNSSHQVASKTKLDNSKSEPLSSPNTFGVVTRNKTTRITTSPKIRSLPKEGSSPEKLCNTSTSQEKSTEISPVPNGPSSVSVTRGMKRKVSEQSRVEPSKRKMSSDLPSIFPHDISIPKALEDEILHKRKAVVVLDDTGNGLVKGRTKVTGTLVPVMVNVGMAGNNSNFEQKNNYQKQGHKRKNLSPVKFSSQKLPEIFADVSRVGESENLQKAEFGGKRSSSGSESKPTFHNFPTTVDISSDSEDEPLIKIVKNSPQTSKVGSPSGLKKIEEVNKSVGILEADKPSPKFSGGSANSNNNASPAKKKSQPYGTKKKSPAKKGKKAKGKKSFHVDDRAECIKNLKLGKTLHLVNQKKVNKSQAAFGPFVRVEGNKKFPDKVTVINQPLHEENLADPRNKLKKKGMGSFHTSNFSVHVANVPSDKSSVLPSTLLTRSGEWVCALCGKCSCYRSLGDLFGPYYSESHLSLLKASEELKVKGKKKVYEATSDKTETSPRRMSMRRLSGERRNSAMSESSDSPQELWVHEDCVLWTDGVYLIGSKLYGLDEAVKVASTMVCSHCREIGAMVGCLHKGCGQKYHYVCASDKGCLLDEENFCLLCPKHKEKKLKAAETKT